MHKFSASLLLILILMASLCGCGNNNKNQSASTELDSSTFDGYKFNDNLNKTDIRTESPLFGNVVVSFYGDNIIKLPTTIEDLLADGYKYCEQTQPIKGEFNEVDELTPGFYSVRLEDGMVASGETFQTYMIKNDNDDGEDIIISIAGTNHSDKSVDAKKLRITEIDLMQDHVIGTTSLNDVTLGIDYRTLISRFGNNYSYTDTSVDQFATIKYVFDYTEDGEYQQIVQFNFKDGKLIRFSVIDDQPYDETNVTTEVENTTEVVETDTTSEVTEAVERTEPTIYCVSGLDMFYVPYSGNGVVNSVSYDMGSEYLANVDRQSASILKISENGTKVYYKDSLVSIDKPYSNKDKFLSNLEDYQVEQNNSVEQNSSTNEIEPRYFKLMKNTSGSEVYVLSSKVVGEDVTKVCIGQKLRDTNETDEANETVNYLTIEIEVASSEVDLQEIIDKYTVNTNIKQSEYREMYISQVEGNLSE